jgi:hypothetical protein
MLSQLSLRLVAHGFLTTVIGRRSRPLADLRDRARSESSGGLVPLALDYSDRDRFFEGVNAHLRSPGRFDLVVCWMHNMTFADLDTFSELLGQHAAGARFVHVVSHSTRRPDGLLHPKARGLFTRRGILYVEVLLGFAWDGRRSRWLTHTEISDGVWTGCSGGDERVVVGQIDPWEMRPG